MSLRKIVRLFPLPAMVVVMLMTTALVAQEPPSKVDIFAGYSWLHPGVNNNGLTGIKDITRGFTVSSTYFVNRYAGFTFDGAGHFGDTASIGTLQIGPTFRLPTENITPF